MVYAVLCCMLSNGRRSCRGRKQFLREGFTAAARSRVLSLSCIRDCVVAPPSPPRHRPTHAGQPSVADASRLR